MICDTRTMLLWFLLSLGSAIAASWVQTMQKWSVSLTRYSKFTITVVASLIASAALLLVSYGIVGIPVIDSRYWTAALATGLLNAATIPLMLKAYEVGEFSSVFSMSLLTPVFLLFTSFAQLGEAPSFLGAAGVILIVLGLWVIASTREHRAAPHFALGNWLAVLVAFLWSISSNFDKLTARYSSPFFAPVGTYAIIAAALGLYLFARHRRLIVYNDVYNDVRHEAGEASVSAQRVPDSRLRLLPGVPPFAVLAITGLTFAASSVVHNAALLLGFVAYTIAIKRLGVIFGVFWGWLFFREKNIRRKLLGSLVAIAGVVIIVLS